MRAEGRRRTLLGLVAVGLVLAECRTGETQAPSRSSPTPSEEVRLLASAFRITGSTAFSPEELAALLADGEGKALTLQEIEALAGRITAHYRTKGYILARAYVPPQDL